MKNNIVYRIRLKDILLTSINSFILFKYNIDFWKFITYFLVILFFNFFIFLFNDLKDANYDFHDLKKRKRNIFLDKKFKKFGFYITVLSSFFIFLIGAYGGYVLLFFGSLLFLLAYNYSSGIRAKNKPFLDLLAHGLWPVLIFITGFIYLKIPLSFKELWFISFSFCLSVIGELFQELRDYNVDLKTNEKTSVVTFGKRFSRNMIKVLFFIVNLSFFVFSRNFLYFLPFLFAYFVLILNNDFKHYNRSTLIRNIYAVSFSILFVIY